MKLTLSASHLADLEKLIATKDENILAASFLSSYLVNNPRLISVNDILKMKRRGLEAEKAFVKALNLKLSEGDEKIANVITHHCSVRCLSKSRKDYESNSYYQKLLSQTIKNDNWLLTQSSYNAYEAFASQDIESGEPYYQEKTYLGYFTEPFSFPAISENQDVWMSITPHEMETMKTAIEQVRGKVAVMGLGLGYFPYMISMKKEVTEIVIVEKDEAIISLFKNHLLTLFPYKEKISVIHTDAFSYAKEELKSLKADFCFVDLWRNVDDGLPMFVTMKKLEKQAPKTKFIYWIETSLLAMIRRFFISLFQEALEGYSASDYLKATTFQDELFNELYAKIGNREFKDFASLLSLLSDQALNDLLSRE